MIEDPNSRYVPLSQAVWSWLADMQEDESRFEQGLHWAIECYDNLNLQMHIDYKVEKLPISAMKTVVWPRNLVQWIRLWIYHNKEWLVFTNRQDIPLGAKEISESLADLHKAPESDSIPVPEAVNQFGEDVGKRFGFRAYNDGIGYYKEYEEEMEFMLSSRVVNSGYVYLEYISDGVEADKDTMVPRAAIRPIKNYLHWMNDEHSPNPNRQRLAERKRQLYYVSLEDFAAIHNPMILEDIVEAFYEGYTLTPKY